MSNKTSDKNVANEEITNNRNKHTYIKEVAERIVNEYREKYKGEEFCPEPSEQTCRAYEILNILAELEQKDKRIQELEEKLLDIIQGTEIINKETPEYVKENYIPKQAVIDELNRHKLAYEELSKMYNNTHYEDDEIRARDFYMIVTEDRIIQVLQELLGGERNESI